MCCDRRMCRVTREGLWKTWGGWLEGGLSRLFCEHACTLYCDFIAYRSQRHFFMLMMEINIYQFIVFKMNCKSQALSTEPGWEPLFLRTVIISFGVDKQWDLAIYKVNSELYPVTCDGTWWKIMWEKKCAYIYICITGSLCWTAEIGTIL